MRSRVFGWPEHVQGWRPIETAPQDRSILLFYPWTGFKKQRTPEGFTFIGVWAATYEDEDYTWRDPDDFEKLGDNPSHWMPLPAPPVEQVKTEVEG